MHRQFAMLPWQWKCKNTQNDEDNYSRSNLASESSCSYYQPTLSNHLSFTWKWNPCSCCRTPSITNIHTLDQSDSRTISIADLSHLLHWQCHHYLHNRIFSDSEENSAQYCAATVRSLWLGWGHPEYKFGYSLPFNSTMEIGKVNKTFQTFYHSINWISGLYANWIHFFLTCCQRPIL